MAVKWAKSLHICMLAIGGALAVSVTGCGGGTTDEDGVIINGDFPIVYAQRNTAALGNPTDGVRFSPGGDLYMKNVSAPLSESTNLTASYTQGQGDVSDPEVNFDASKVVFAMRGPNDSTFNIWEIDLGSNTMSRLIQDTAVAELADDVDPAYLPDGRIVFSSSRQKTTQQKMLEENVQPYTYLDEYEREQTIALHVFDPITQEITQISFNQSHDRNATVLKTGEIMYSRWDHFANRNHFPVFFANPDGTNLFVEYGAFSPGNSFLHPREMQDGRVMTSLMPLSGTNEAGAIMLLDVKNYSDACEPGPGLPQNCNGQTKVQLTNLTVSYDDEFSPGGRFTTPYPLWDGTNRALVSFRPAPPNPTAVTDPMTGVSELDQGVPEYSIYMMDLSSGTLRPVHLATSGRALVDPIAIIPRGLGDTPAIIGDKFPDPALATESNGLGGTGMGVFNVRSVYDTDGLDIMGDSVLAAGEVIPKTITGEPDLALMKDPSTAEFANRVARFVRVTRAIPTPPGMIMDAIGESEFEMQEILGYTQIEPDGSYRVKVPADTALAMTVLDREGRAFQTHTNWLQVRPGEVRTCNGCHSPRRATEPLNSAPIAGSHAVNINNWAVAAGETMADTKANNDPTSGDLQPNIIYTPVWAAISVGGIQQQIISYDDLDTPPPVAPNGRIRINYEEHIQPLWDKVRPDVLGECSAAGAINDGGCTCVNCHNNALLANEAVSAGLTLEGGLGGLGGRIISYDQLLVGTFEKDILGQPLPPVVQDGEVVFLRNEPLVSVGGSANSSRTSHLIETIYNRKLRADNEHTLGALDHSLFMNASEKRLVTEWVDIGAQYINDPFELVGGVYQVKADLLSNVGVSQAEFNTNVHPRLMTDCQSCHAPGEDADNSANPSSGQNRFVLTGNASGDFNVTISMINDLCTPANNDLLLRPISDNVAPNLPHPQVLVNPANPAGATQPVLVDTSPNSTYGVILNWISMGAANNPTCI
ncbi:MAG: hypothetical protein R8G33_04255 [Gammaproteobacteria bacterium]|nr:hypothetical protein [Gammaproteobacteria bacterium]